MEELLTTFGGLIPLIAIFIIFYFLIFRPQIKKQNEHQQMLENLQKNDKVITAGGIFGVIKNINDDILNVEIADGVIVKMSKATISDIIKD